MKTISFDTFNSHISSILYEVADVLYTISGKEKLLVTNQVVQKGVNESVHKIIEWNSYFLRAGENNESGNYIIGSPKKGFNKNWVTYTKFKSNTETLATIGLTMEVYHGLILHYIESEDLQVRIGEKRYLCSKDNDLCIKHGNEDSV